MTKRVGRPSLSDTPSKRMTFRVSDEELELFENKVKRVGSSKSKILRELVKQWIEE